MPRGPGVDHVDHPWHKDAGGPGTLVFIVHTPRMLFRRGHRNTLFLGQWHRLLIHAQHRKTFVVRLCIGVPTWSVVPSCISQPLHAGGHGMQASKVRPPIVH